MEIVPLSESTKCIAHASRGLPVEDEGLHGSNLKVLVVELSSNINVLSV